MLNICKNCHKKDVCRYDVDMENVAEAIRAVKHPHIAKIQLTCSSQIPINGLEGLFSTLGLITQPKEDTDGDS